MSNKINGQKEKKGGMGCGLLVPVVVEIVNTTAPSTAPCHAFHIRLSSSVPVPSCVLIITNKESDHASRVNFDCVCAAAFAGCFPVPFR